MTTLQLTRGQIERTLSQRIQALYRERLGHQPSKVTCELFDEKLTILLENSITPAEQLLLEEGKEESVEHLRSDLDEVIQPYIKTTIEEVLGISVLDLLSDATLETGRMGLIVILESAPSFRTSPGRNRRQ
ncbi:DUF2294 domain-containing protein [Oscillatoriales cyanobacterium LEGE 11467]|uniref:DUF2294 domain-containing protein n=1 Tax=Zarconia navalis LEGE 11467 TaxID=1828826 RepID=A0A928VYG9_9CYAN|nr:DUF2294 domain-containing protein [Zarconia navalis]MBE9041954.1 DUF2294 domain-containing protein [Zarconia navalis LEGE 11467]